MMNDATSVNDNILQPAADSPPIPGTPAQGYELEGNTVTTTIALVLTAISVLIYIPLCLYFIYPFFRARNDIILTKRYIKLSILAAMFAFIEVVAQTLCAIFTFKVVTVPDSNDNATQLISITQLVLNALIIFAGNCFICVMFVRFWLVYYDINYNILMATDKWKSIIDVTYNTDNNFFIQNKSKWGNQRYLMRFIYIDMVINLIITALLMYVRSITCYNINRFSNFHTFCGFCFCFVCPECGKVQHIMAWRQ